MNEIAETPSQKACKQKCPETPKPDDYQEPCYPDDKIYDGIPAAEKAAIKATYDTAIWTADEAYAGSKAAAEIAKATAEAAHDVAVRKADSAVEVLKEKVTIAKKKLWIAYEKCLQDALPNKCKDTEKDVPDEDKAICIAQLIQGMTKEDLEYQKEIQKICQEKADAESAWAKAKKQYDSDICIADATRKEAVEAAQVERRKELSVALKAVCSI